VDGGNSDAAMPAAFEQMMAGYIDNWPLFLAISIIQFIGAMSLLALLTDRSNPTVGEALSQGIRSIPSYLAAQILTSLGLMLAIGIPLGIIAAAAPPAVLVLAMVAALVAFVYLYTKFSLTAPVIAIEGERNPLAALVRSWRLTKGNVLRIVLFVFLLVFTLGIIIALVSGILGLILSAIGEPVTTIGIDMVSALANALLTVVLLVVTVAIHRQLAGPSTAALAETFE
jgi:flagellar biosynthesis protein FlhB